MRARTLTSKIIAILHCTCTLTSKIITASRYFDSVIPHLNKCRGWIQVTILMTEFWLTADTARMTQFDHLHESQSSVEEGKSANSDDRILTTTDTAQTTHITRTNLIISTNLRVVLRKANLQILMTEF